MLSVSFPTALFPVSSEEKTNATSCLFSTPVPVPSSLTKAQFAEMCLTAFLVLSNQPHRGTGMESGGGDGVSELKGEMPLWINANLPVYFNFGMMESVAVDNYFLKMLPLNVTLTLKCP